MPTYLYLLRFCYSNLLFLFLLKDVFGTGAFQIQLDSIKNVAGQLRNSSCCDGVRTMYFKEERCMEPCNTYFRICLKQYEETIRTSGPCRFGSAITPVLGSNSFNIPTGNSTTEAGVEFENPISLPFTFSWLVSSILSFLCHKYLNFLYSMPLYAAFAAT